MLMDSELNCPVAKMRASDLPVIAIDHFKKAYDQVVRGDDQMIHESDIDSIGSIKKYEELNLINHEKLGTTLDQSVVIKLNGGLYWGKFFNVFLPVRSRFHALGYIRIHSDAFGNKNRPTKF